MSLVTWWQWLRQAVVRKSDMEARRPALQRAIARTRAITSEAVERLREVMKSNVTSASAPVAAAKAILGYAISGIELEDHEQRLAELNARLEAR